MGMSKALKKVAHILDLLQHPELELQHLKLIHAELCLLMASADPDGRD